MKKGDRVIAKERIEDPDWKGRGITEIGSKGTILEKRHNRCFAIRWDNGTTTWKVLPESIDYSKSNRKINKPDSHILRRDFWKTYEGVAKVNEDVFEPGKKGECFANARTWAWKHDDGNTFIVHGKVTNVENKTFDHAWVEQGKDVVDPTIGVRMDKKKYYTILHAQPETKYTPYQATMNIIRSGKMGPWFNHEIESRYTWRKDKGTNPTKSIEEHKQIFNEEKLPYLPISKLEEQESLNILFQTLSLFKDDSSAKNKFIKKSHEKHILTTTCYVDHIGYELKDDDGIIYKITISKIPSGMIYRLGIYKKEDNQFLVINTQSWDWIEPNRRAIKYQIFESASDHEITPKEEKEVVDFALKGMMNRHPGYNYREAIKKIRHDKLPNGGDEIEYGGIVIGTFHGHVINTWQGFVIRKLRRVLQKGTGGIGSITRAPDDPNEPPTIGYALTQRPDEGKHFGNESYRWFRIIDDKHTQVWPFNREPLEEIDGQTGYYHGQRGAGAIILAKTTGRILLPYRSRNVHQPHTWGTWGGAIEEGENPTSAVKREILEEIGQNIQIDELIPLFIYKDSKQGFEFHNFLAVVSDEFIPKLNWETEKAEWFKYGAWPRPVHFGLKILLDRSEEIIKLEVKKYMKDPSLIKTKKMSQLKFKSAYDLIQKVWRNMSLNNSLENYKDRFDYDDLIQWLLNEDETRELLTYYGRQFYPFDDEPDYTFLNDVENALEELELRYNRKLSRYVDPTDSLYILKKLVKNKSWEKAKYDLAKFSLSGPIVSVRRISDEEAEEIFVRLFLNAMGETFYIPSQMYNTPRLDTLDKTTVVSQYVKDCLQHYLPKGMTKFPEKVKVYRGTNSPMSKIRPGDFCSFDRDFARSFIRGKYGAVVRDLISSHDLLLYKIDRDSSELVYWPEGHQIKKYEGQIPKFKDFFLQNR